MRFFSLDGSGERRNNLLLAPTSLNPGPFRRMLVDPSIYRARLAEAQRLRGRIALQEGAVDRTQLLADGRHVQEADRHGWHLLTLDAQGHVAACMRYVPYGGAARFHDLSISRSSLAQSMTWGEKLRSAVETDLRSARQRGCAYVELGGWVISEALRCTTEALRMIATAYAFAQLCGGALGLTTASTRRCSASILKRIGGQQMQARGVDLPSFYDAHYRCHMEVLRFDSSRPNPRYRRWMDACRSGLENVPVICSEPADVRPMEMIAHKGNPSNIRVSELAEMAS
jgi:hypothetical protein